jgi:hypothetical protein
MLEFDLAYILDHVKLYASLLSRWKVAELFLERVPQEFPLANKLLTLKGTLPELFLERVSQAFLMANKLLTLEGALPELFLERVPQAFPMAKLLTLKGTPPELFLERVSVDDSSISNLRCVVALLLWLLLDYPLEVGLLLKKDQS